jgi:23S rRNA pseudouridine1911/1915/1917 synthase
MQVLFADNHIIVVEKPSGIATEGEDQSLEDLVGMWARDHYQKTGNVFIKAAHRLDKPASGIVIFAKTSKALTRLHAAFRQRKVEKMYIALLEGYLPQEEGVFEDFLLKEEYKTTPSKDPKAKKAILSFKVIARSQGRTLVQVALDTGRYHQIRVQFSCRGYPIVGDHKYGAKSFLKEKEIALHHEQIRFPHPISQEDMSFCLKPTKAFLQSG